MFKDYYKILGITSDASPEEIKKAYRTQSMRWHPDPNPGADTTAMMQDINEAYNILKDPSTRERYDREYSQYNSTFYSQTETPKNKNDYDIQDETLKEDIRVARKSAEDYVREFYASLKKDTQKAAHGAWEETKGYVIVGVVMSLLVLIIGMCNANIYKVPTTETKDASYYQSKGYQVFSKFRLAVKAPVKLEDVSRQANGDFALNYAGIEDEKQSTFVLYQVIVSALPVGYQDYSEQQTQNVVESFIKDSMKGFTNVKKVRFGEEGNIGYVGDTEHNGYKQRGLIFYRKGHTYALTVITNYHLEQRFNRFTNGVKFY